MNLNNAIRFCRHGETVILSAIKASIISAALILLGACSGGGGAETAQNTPPSGGGSSSNYSGPAPASSDAQKFYINFWQPMVDKCGNCHTDGGQSPAFVRDDDVNLAYEEAITIVNLSDPAKSRAVEKVAGGHNCWLSNPNDCADYITQAIARWAGGSGGASNEVTFTAPEIIEPGASRSFPDSADSFGSLIWTPYLTNPDQGRCNTCHSEKAATPQQPFFASANLETAYAAVKSKINLDEPSRSRLVIRLRDEFHNCWSNCTDDAAEMLEAITDFANGTVAVELDPDLIPSKALKISDGIIASGGGRYEPNLVALWQFKTGAGSVAVDTSAVEPAIDMNMSGDYSWVGGWGVQFRGDGMNPAKAQSTTTAAKKLHNMIQASGEYTIETWAAPANVSQDNSARIVSYSGGPANVNFALGQSLYNYDFLMRHSNTAANGQPMLSTKNTDERAQATLQHVVVTYSPLGGRKIYVNGEYTQDADSVAAGSLAEWDDKFALVFGNETDGQSQWEGILKMVAIHNRALTPEQVTQNYKAGVGERYYLLFSISHWVPTDKGCMKEGKSQCYIVVEVSQFDNFGYLFNAPFFVSLDPAIDLSDVPLQKMRIGINGREAPVGQVYAKLMTTVGKHKDPLSTLGTVITIEKGAENDEFFLTFELLGTGENVVIEADPPPPPSPEDLDPVSDIGVRTFDEINATMSAITGISRNDSDVKTTYATIKQSLPAIESISAFGSSHQMAITQLAIKYCDKLIRDTSKRATFFPGFNFAASASTAFNGGGTDLVIDPLLKNITSNGLSTQPIDNDVRTELNLLINGGTQSIDGHTVTYPGLKNTSSTESVVKAACAAALGSSAMLVQ